jgi:hypothetical protein
MAVIDDILLEWSYRCSDGIVDIANPVKREILNIILKENGLSEIELEEANNVTYDDVVLNALKKANLAPNGNIPQVKKEYNLGGDSVKAEDIDVFKALYRVAPPKANKGIEEAGSKGTGHGEIALYWLFAHQPGHTASGNQGGGKPDLIIDGRGVEVKAYDSKNMGLGRIGSDKDNIDLLNTLFGLNSLVSTIEKTGKDKKANALNFSKEDIIDAFKTVQEFNKNTGLKDLKDKYPLIGLIYDKIKKLTDALTSDPNILFQTDYTAEEAAAALVKKILIKKLETKPGFEPNGFIVNIKEDGTLDYKEVDKAKILALDKEIVLSSVSINQGSLIINPENLFK